MKAQKVLEKQRVALQKELAVIDRQLEGSLEDLCLQDDLAAVKKASFYDTTITFTVRGTVLASDPETAGDTLYDVWQGGRLEPDDLNSKDTRAKKIKPQAVDLRDVLWWEYDLDDCCSDRCNGSTKAIVAFKLKADKVVVK